MRNCWNTASAENSAMAWSPAHAVGIESAAAMADSSIPSVRNCRSNRPPRAPIAVRTASSRARPAARTMIRFETFAVAIAISTPIDSRKSAITTQKPWPPVSSRIGMSRNFQPRLVSGNSFASASPIAANSAAARSKVTPSRNRAMKRRFLTSRGPSGLNSSGSQRSISARLPNSMSGDSTPTTVTISRPICRVRPIASARPPISSRQ